MPKQFPDGPPALILKKTGPGYKDFLRNGQAVVIITDVIERLNSDETLKNNPAVKQALRRLLALRKELMDAQTAILNDDQAIK